METARKIDHSKDEYYLAFVLMNRDSDDCPLDNKYINNGFIEDKGMSDLGLQRGEDRHFKCFTLHPIINKQDIVPYTYGDIGYDLNPESMRVYIGGWKDIASCATANGLADDFNFLSKKKNGNLYLGYDCVDKVMYKKFLNRAKLLKDAIRKSKNKDPKEILQSMFISPSKNDDDSFCKDNYTLEKIENSKNSNIWKLTGINKVENQESVREFKKHGIHNNVIFELFYDESNDKIYFNNCNELDGVAKDKTRGIKVDRIFVRESGDWGLNALKYRGKASYNAYINKLTDVLIQQFPFGEIRVVKGDIYTGQTNVFLSPEEFINKYFVNEDDKKEYLDKLKNKRKSIITTKTQTFKEMMKQNVPNIQSLGNAKYKIDPKSGKNKIFLNEKWYDRMHFTENSIVKSQINKVFDSYVLGKINDEDAKQQLDNIVNRHRPFFNSTYC